MTLRKKTFDNSVRYIPKLNKQQKVNQKLQKPGSLPSKRNKKLSQINKNSIKCGSNWI